MKPAENRRSFLTLRTVGRAFWIGLALSLALHAFFLAKGRFPLAQLEGPPALEARLVPEAFDAVTLPAPEIPSKPAPPKEPSPSAPEPQPQAGPFAPFPDLPLTAIVSAEEAPPPAPPEQALPLSGEEQPPPSAQPHALLAQAAERIRNLPAHVEIVYELKGMLSGRQIHTWQRNGEHYTLEAEAEATGLTSLFIGGKLVQKSRGRIGPLGLMPEHYEMLRPSGKNEALAFDYSDNVIESVRTDAKRGRRALELPLMTGAQDPLSSIYQLALVAREGQDGLIVSASSKKVRGYPYQTVGMETLRTALGEVKTLHVARRGDTERSGSHLWLSPEHYSLPVKVTYADEDGTQWVLEAVSIQAR